MPTPLPRLPRLLLPLLPLLLCCAAQAQPSSGPVSRGALLYETHCITCHTEQMHWRDQRRARDWATLREQVGRWQGEARLNWDSDDIEAVARYLNDTIYRFPAPDSQAKAGPFPQELRSPAGSR